MKGIREAAMSIETKPAPTTRTEMIPYSYDDGYDYGYPTTPHSGRTTYKSNAQKAYKGEITITIYVSLEEIGPVADDSDPLYNWDKASVRATEIAYDQIQALAGKGFESRYEIDCDVQDLYTEFEAIITLTPVS